LSRPDFESGEQVQAVLFDFAGTLFAPEHAERQVALASGELGIALTADEQCSLAAQFLQAGMPGGPYPHLVPEGLRAAYEQRDLGPDAHRAAYVALMSTVPGPEGLAAAVYERIRLADGWIAYSDTYTTLDALSELDVTVGLVSNVGFDIRPILRANGLDELALHATLSFEHNVEKPAPEIFQRALSSVNAEPAHTLMVGDHPLTDGGAAALGIQTLILPMSAPGREHGLHRVLEVVKSTRGRAS